PQVVSTAHATVNVLDQIANQPLGPPNKMIREHAEWEVHHPAFPNPILGTMKSVPALQADLVTPRPVLDFAGLGDDQTADPPDTNGSVGPSHVVTCLNDGLLFAQRDVTKIRQEYSETCVNPVAR